MKRNAVNTTQTPFKVVSATTHVSERSIPKHKFRTFASLETAGDSALPWTFPQNPRLPLPTTRPRTASTPAGDRQRDGEHARPAVDYAEQQRKTHLTQAGEVLGTFLEADDDRARVPGCRGRRKLARYPCERRTLPRGAGTDRVPRAGG